ncbi:Nif3-like dinuclear metal center hexameric protein [Sulfidibacter corallicola]|uniref:GTP cyclohydrolase 1 type 2 homolog n=1 Tax=Sulfidibacter corallicola TaxID=2818388 RepID=A0A8A4TVV3_SULCO|nr:Nif3-like dinuclear metal center hexameric protein [Sulfidibacter corallicola]QTD54069.1 Nif3-like dinuclear metal center hexameric protein [Sulfidibacter corallicola]
MSEIDLGRLVSHLNQYLRVNEFREGAVNGLQVAGKKRIKRVAFAVDGVLETFRAAAAWGADMLLVHHGIYWGFQYPLRGPDYQRVKTLMDADMALYAVHLPLDAHGEVGHNVELLRALEVDPETLEPFGDYKGVSIGFQARFPRQLTRDAVTERLERVLGGSVQLLPFGPEKVRSVACVTGQGADFALVREAKIGGIHYYISGEANHPIYHYAKENGVTVALGGHYNTEVFGLHALRRYIEERFQLETLFIDCPTGM